jgi:hypothetical protein
MALKKFFESDRRRSKISRHNLEFYTANFGVIQKKHFVFIRDFLYKNDYMTPRMSVLMTPRAYCYFTYQAFMLVYKIFEIGLVDDTLSFSTNHVKVFYAGRLNFKGNSLFKNATYNDSFKEFQKRRFEYRGFRILKLDIQDFFLGIKPALFLFEVQKICKSKHISAPNELSNIIALMNYCGYSSLPQCQSSTAASILSQLYLTRFTEFLENLCLKHDLEIVRYVDDMYIRLPDKCPNRLVNYLIEQISSELWKYGLNLNTNKIKLFSIREYEKFTEWANQSAESGTPFQVSENINNKVKLLLENNGSSLVEYFSKIENLRLRHGYDMQRYGKLTSKFFQVGSDNVNKVQNSLIFGGLWKGKLGIAEKEKIDSMAAVIGFDPAKYVTFFLMIETNLESITHKSVYNGVKNFIQKEHKMMIDDSYTIRNGITDSQYFIQKRKFLDKSDYRLIEVNKPYMQFIYSILDQRI